MPIDRLDDLFIENSYHNNDIADNAQKPDDEFKCSNADELIAKVNDLYKAAASSTLLNYWQIGTLIKQNYKPGYIKGGMQAFAQKAGIPYSIATKAKQFASTFSPEQVQKLGNASFQVSWRNLANHLTLGADALVEVASKSSNAKDFNRNIGQLRLDRGLLKTNLSAPVSKKKVVHFLKKVKVAINEAEIPDEAKTAIIASIKKQEGELDL